MSATDELRRMLDERGVEWTASGTDTCWTSADGYPMRAWDTTNGTHMRVADLTTEQAIAATLGSDDRYDAGFTSGVQAVFQQLEGIEDYEELQCFIAEYRGEGEGYDER